ncbi:class I SAM-dependent methyltransferase [Haliea sp. E17]|uniref:class I SAM-dependent methyltransferase n=1 Tax=Haliea sp. E17 TaxID=3401576 RepID=UPI003AAD1FE6
MPDAMPDPAPIAICALQAELEAQAAHLAAQLGLPQLPTATHAKNCKAARALLLLGPSSLSLQLTGSPAPGPVTVDFGAAGMRHRRSGGHNELLGRAIGVHKKPALRVLDATAGLGRDAFVLADLGARVELCERNPVIAALLRSGLQAAGEQGDPWLGAVTARMQLREVDARSLPVEALEGIDVIYLDPMFPQRDKHAAVKKEMTLFQLLLGSGDDSGDSLLAWALQQAVARVVVKRPRKAPPLGGRKPSHLLSGKSVRFDVYTLGSFAEE